MDQAVILQFRSRAYCGGAECIFKYNFCYRKYGLFLGVDQFITLTIAMFPIFSLPRQHLPSLRDKFTRHIVSCSAINYSKHALHTILNSDRRSTRITPLFCSEIASARLHPSRMQSKGNQSVCFILRMKGLGQPIRCRFTGTVGTAGQRLLASNRTDRGRDDRELRCRN